MRLAGSADRFRIDPAESSTPAAYARAAELGFCPVCASVGQFVPTMPGADTCRTHTGKRPESHAQPVTSPEVPDYPAEAETAHSADTARPAGRFCRYPTRRRRTATAPRPDGRYSAPHMVAVICAVPVGSRRVRDQAEAFRVLDDHPALIELRADRLARTRAIWRALVLRAEWHTMTYCGTWDVLAAEAGVSRSTVARAVRWLRGAGLLGVVHTGASVAAIGGDTNRAPTYVLCVPAVCDVSPARGPVDEIDTPPRSGRSVRIQNARGNVDQDPAPLRGLDNPAPTTRRPPETIMSVQPVTRRARLDAADALRWHSLALRGMSARMLRHVLRDVFAAGWSPRDVLYALDHRPDGRPWTYTTSPRVAAAWARHRLAAWRDPAGDVLPSRSQRARVEADRVWAARAARAAGRDRT